MKANNKPTKIEFIHNPDFVEWVLRPSGLSDQYWESYLVDHPLQKKDLEQARFLIKGLVRQQKSLADHDVSALWYKIKQSDLIRTRKMINFNRWSAAASILIILGLAGWWISSNKDHEIQEINYRSIAVNINPGKDITLILSDRTEKTFSANDVELNYNQQGKLETRVGKQVQTEALTPGSEMEQMNQLVVPRGKRSCILLADGTKLWLNSGSRAIYPVAFNGKNREIYIEGESYIEVANDATKPFFVVTDLVKVKVLGTKFDISAYKGASSVSVVLVEGSLLASTTTENLVMKPNQILNFEKLTLRSTIENTNVMEYVSWKDGWLLCNKEQIQSIITKLSRYYDIKISYNDLRLSNMTITGKLDLKSNCEDVMKVICETAPIKYEIIDNMIFLTIK